MTIPMNARPSHAPGDLESPEKGVRSKAFGFDELRVTNRSTPPGSEAPLNELEPTFDQSCSD